MPRNFIGPINKFKFLPWLSPYAAELDSAIGTSFPGLFRLIDDIDRPPRRYSRWLIRFRKFRELCHELARIYFFNDAM